MVDLSDHSVADVDRLLVFLYTGDYSDTRTESADAAASSNTDKSDEAMSSLPANDSSHDSKVDEDGPSAPLRNARMYAMGDRYDIAPLKQMAKSRFSVAILTTGLFSGVWPELLEYVYTSTPDSDRGLRDPMQELCGLGAEYLLTNQAIVNLMLEVPTIALDMCKGLLALAKSQHDLKRERIEALQNKLGESRCKLELAAAQNSQRLRMAESKLDKYQALVGWLRDCGDCGRAWKMAPSGSNPLIFAGCLDCQTARGSGRI